MPNAITMLKADHVVLKRLLRELNDATTVKQRERLAGELERAIKTHAQIEEEVFYPAFKARTEKTDDVDMFYEAAEEHHVVDMVLPALKAANPKSPEFEAKAKVMKDLVEHHIKEEEKEMFAAARKVFDEDQLRELGDLMQSRRETIEAMWDSPLLRPMKKIQSVAHKFLPTKVKTAKATAIAKAMPREEAR
ncbi:MAG TPA: hemerythrin domain-containing protein [Thermoanaerobaculia bacterium]|jgi:hemerythrin-like domain-containing protein|nr:hemerythrin domain-containing protein [Thermoanaerobaculia bacterium]